ncbi:hypothetical protein ACFXCZ_27340 [Streptomyces sp. NPDC059396]|uniref:hypothetical protein n=1 Tax=Streptomyces sp. NPDC059396 TaxID=3346819 RepID=UPI003680EFA9
MTVALDTYLSWELLTHRPHCKSPAWTVDIRTEDDAYRSLHDGERHECRNEDCGHGNSYARTTVRIVCTSCGVVELIKGEEVGRRHTSARYIGYGLPPRRVAGLFLYSGEPFLSWDRLDSPEPFDFVVTAERVDRVEQRHVVGMIQQGRGKRGAVKWIACAVPSPDGTYGYGHIRWAHAADHRSVGAAAKWIAGRQAEASVGVSA